MSRYLIDTNVLSQPLQPPAPSQRALERLRLHTDEIAIASVTWHEIRYGCLRLPASRRREQIEQYRPDVQATFPILPYDGSAAEWHFLRTKSVLRLWVSRQRMQMDRLRRKPIPMV